MLFLTLLLPGWSFCSYTYPFPYHLIHCSIHHSIAFCSHCTIYTMVVSMSYYLHPNILFIFDITLWCVSEWHKWFVNNIWWNVRTPETKKIIGIYSPKVNASSTFPNKSTYWVAWIWEPQKVSHGFVKRGESANLCTPLWGILVLGIVELTGHYSNNRSRQVSDVCMAVRALCTYAHVNQVEANSVMEHSMGPTTGALDFGSLSKLQQWRNTAT